MPYLSVNDAQIHFEEAGNGKETIVFAHSLLCNLSMYTQQVKHFSRQYRCIAFDFRGQGKSETTPEGYDMDTLTEDARELIEQLDVGPCHFVGLSMGGFVGLRLAIRYPQLLRSLTLIDTSMEPEDKKNLPKYNALSLIAKLLGFKIVTGNVLPIMFSKNFLEDPDKDAIKNQWKEDLINGDRKGILNAVKGVITREGLSGEEVESIQIPTLIVVGDKDVATPPHKSEKIHQHIPHSELKIVPEAGHLSALEKPGEIIRHMETFLVKQAIS